MNNNSINTVSTECDSVEPEDLNLATQILLAELNHEIPEENHTKTILKNKDKSKKNTIGRLMFLTQPASTVYKFNSSVAKE